MILIKIEWLQHVLLKLEVPEALKAGGIIVKLPPTFSLLEWLQEVIACHKIIFSWTYSKILMDWRGNSCKQINH